MKVRVLIISGAYPPISDGVGDYTKILADELMKLGVDLRIMTSRYQGIQSSTTVLPIISAWNVCSLGRILKIIRDTKPSLVHIQYPSFGYKRYLTINIVPVVIRVFFGSCRVIVTQHEFSIYSIVGKLRSAIHLLFAHGITTTTARNLDQIVHFLPPLRRRVVYLPIASNIPVTLKESKRKRPFTISYFGIVRPRKGLETLIETLSGMEDFKFVFLIIGQLRKENSYHRKVLKLLKRTGLLEHTRITGHCDDMAVSGFLATSDICVLPFSEGVSERRGTFLAALQHRVPVVTTEGEAVPSGLIDGSNVKLVKPEDVEGLGAAIRALIDDDKLRKRIADGGYEWSKRFSWNHTAKETFSLYVKLLRTQNP
jgi:glycosyltransferase involved in cell wall biosynthesis